MSSSPTTGRRARYGARRSPDLRAWRLAPPATADPTPDSLRRDRAPEEWFHVGRGRETFAGWRRRRAGPQLECPSWRARETSPGDVGQGGPRTSPTSSDARHGSQGDRLRPPPGVLEGTRGVPRAAPDSLDNLMAIVDELITVAELERGTSSSRSPRSISSACPPRGGRDEPVQPRSSRGSLGEGRGYRRWAASAWSCVSCSTTRADTRPTGRARRARRPRPRQGGVVMATDGGEGLDRAVAPRRSRSPSRPARAPSTGEGRRGRPEPPRPQIIVEHGGII